MPGAALLVIMGSLIVTQTLFGGALERLGVKALVGRATAGNPIDSTVGAVSDAVNDPLGTIADNLWPF